MAYTPTNWECGDVVTAEKLNKLEEAVENLSVIVDGMDGGSELPLTISLTTEGDTSTMDKTWQEIADAYPCVRVVNDGYYSVEVYEDETNDEYGVVVGYATPRTFTTDSADGYPTYTTGDA